MENWKYLYNEIHNDCLQPYHGYRCRSCSNCLSSNTKLWTQRLLSEFVESDEMITFCLTYTDMMLRNPLVGASPFEEITFENMFSGDYPLKHEDWREPCLSKRDGQLFIKRLRERIGENATIKYFLKGEYGGDKGRPHIHGIIFYHNSNPSYGLFHKKDDIMKCWYDGMYKEYKQPLYYSHILNVNKRIRINPVIEFGTINLKTIAYICKYTAKEVVKGKFASSNYVPEFTLKSRHIGASLFEKQLIDKQEEAKALFARYDKDKYKGAYSDFERLFLQVFTYHNSLKNVDVFMPKYLYSQFFNGYYIYPVHKYTKEYDKLKELWQKGKLEANGINYKRLFSKDKFWHKIEDKPSFGQKEYDMFSEMKELVLQHNIKDMFNVDIVNDGEKGYPDNNIFTALITHRKEVLQKEKNRRTGAYKYRINRYSDEHLNF